MLRLSVAKKSKDKRTKEVKKSQKKDINLEAAPLETSKVKEQHNDSEANQNNKDVSNDKNKDRFIVLIFILTLFAFLVSFLAFLAANLEINLEQNTALPAPSLTSRQTSTAASSGSSQLALNAGSSINQSDLSVSSNSEMFSPVIRTNENTTSSLSVSSSSNVSEQNSATQSFSGEAVEDDQANTTQQGTVTSSVAGSSTKASYTFYAQKGESVSKLARKAIAQYLAETSTSLSAAQRLFIEVNLTNASNPVFLEIGESRSFSVDLVSDLVEQSKNLSQKSLNAWQRQANSVNYR